MYGPMLPISAVQAVVVVLADASDGAIAAALIGGIFLIANTIITVILTKVLSKHDSSDRREDREDRERREERLENDQSSSDRAGGDDDFGFEWTDDRSPEPEREGGRDPD